MSQMFHVNYPYFAFTYHGNLYSFTAPSIRLIPVLLVFFFWDRGAGPSQSESGRGEVADPWTPSWLDRSALIRVRWSTWREAALFLEPGHTESGFLVGVGASWANPVRRNVCREGVDSATFIPRGSRQDPCPSLQGVFFFRRTRPCPASSRVSRRGLRPVRGRRSRRCGGRPPPMGSRTRVRVTAHRN